MWLWLGRCDCGYCLLPVPCDGLGCVFLLRPVVARLIRCVIAEADCDVEDTGTAKKQREKRSVASASGAGADPHAGDIDSDDVDPVDEALVPDDVDIDVVLSALRDAM